MAVSTIIRIVNYLLTYFVCLISHGISSVPELHEHLACRVAAESVNALERPLRGELTDIHFVHQGVVAPSGCIDASAFLQQAAVAGAIAKTIIIFFISANL